MEKWKIILAIGLFFIGVGLFFGAAAESREFCTFMACMCLSGEAAPERECNECTTIDPIFVLGDFDISLSCPVQEYTTCVAGGGTTSRYETTWIECKVIMD
jgi:hypothetical protein